MPDRTPGAAHDAISARCDGRRAPHSEDLSLSSPEDLGVVAKGRDGSRLYVNALALAEQIGMGHHGFDAGAVLKIKVNQAVAAKVGDAMDPGRAVIGNNQFKVLWTHGKRHRP